MMARFGRSYIKLVIHPALLSGTANKAGSDTASGAESQSIQVILSNADSASGVDGQSVSNSVTSSDTGSGVEGAPKIAVSSSDTVAGTETNSIGATRSDSDSASGADSGFISQTSSDAGHGTENQSTAVTLSNSDSAHGTDTGTPTSPFPFSADAASATESFSIVVSLSNSDSTHGAESQSVSAPPVVRDPKDYPNIIVLGPGSVFLADYGAVEPTTAGTPDPLVWTDLGGILGGVDLTIEEDYKIIELAQMPDTQIRRLEKRHLTVKMELAEATLQNLVYALNEPLASITSGAGYSSYSPSMAVSPGTALTYRAVLVRGWSPGFTGSQHKRRTFIIRKGLSVDDVEMKYAKEGQTTYTVTWSCHYAGSGVAPFFIIDET
jgi:hypothetical protein